MNGGLYVPLRVVTWNLGNARLGDVRVKAHAWTMQEASDKDEFLKDMCDEFDLKMIRGRKSGQPATPMLYDPKRLHLEEKIEHMLAHAQTLDPGTGPEHMKTKWLQGGYFTDIETGRKIAICSLHCPPGQTDNNVRDRVATAMAQNAVGYMRQYRGIRVIGADWNAEMDTDSLAPMRRAGYHCDQLVGKRMPTHDGWCPDGIWWYNDDRVRFMGHTTNPTHSDHDQDVVDLNILKRANLR